MKKLIRISVFIVICLVVSLSMLWGGYDKSKDDKPKPKKEDIYSQVELFSDAISVIRSDYVDDVDSKKIIYGAMKGMLSSLDDFSSFMEPDEYKEIKAETKGEFGGIGVEIGTRDGIITIISPISGTPAEAAGIKALDRVVKINGEITKNMSLNDAVKKMRGDPGTAIALTIWREAEEKVFDISLTRAIIKINSIKKASILEDKIGYVKLVEFQENTPRDLEDALKKLESSGMDALIIDIRNNPGGLLDVAIDVAEKFLPKDKVIVSTKSRTPDQNIVFKSKGRFQHPDYPIVVLANEGSASASEILAGAIQDNKRGVILGTKTFGKASVQTVIPLKDGSALRLTTASYYTPSGKMIRNQGIIPDVVVASEECKPKASAKPMEILEKLEEEKARQAEKVSPKAVPPKEEKVERDNQLDRAVDLIKGIKAYKTIKT